MAKNVKRVLSTILILIFSYQKFTYADMIIDSTSIDYIEPTMGMVVFISIIVLIVSAISFLCLKATIKTEYNSKKSTVLNSDDIEKRKHRIQRRVYIWSVILSIAGLIYLWLNDQISNKVLIIFIIIFIISFTIRLYKKKKVSNIICGISVMIILWNIVSYKIVVNYNHQFYKYEHRMGLEERVSEVEGLINTIINNNKIGKKVTLVYQNTNYTSTDELKELLNKVNKSKDYYVIDYKFDKNNYIESIALNTTASEYSSTLQEEYEGKNPGRKVKVLINQIRNNYLLENNDNIIINIVYKDITITLKYMDDSESITNLINEIKDWKKYNLEFQIKADEEFNIVITQL